MSLIALDVNLIKNRGSAVVTQLGEKENYFETPETDSIPPLSPALHHLYTLYPFSFSLFFIFVDVP
jgi:hypothetical protein